MCAINGFNFNNKELLLKMNETTQHRGPDGTGHFINDNISLGHNRLSIIDLSEQASQPMKGAEGNLIITYNGEIYNFKKIKEQLKDKYSFRSDSDTEVILAAYQEWGGRCVEYFEGIFAFAIWDERNKELFLARDHIGVKPLYYFWDGNKFIFSSEIKAILEHDVPRILDKDAFNLYLRVLYVPGPKTMFKDIFKLMPAHRATLKNNQFVVERYWEESNEKPVEKSKKELARELKNEICQATKKQLISDRPLGIYLSGGFDSTSILNCVTKIRDKVNTFSAGYELNEEEENKKFNDDAELAKRAADYYKADHNNLYISENNLLEDLEKIVWHLDEPIANPTTVAMFSLAKFTKQKVSVVLAGDGGDELFGGYKRYRYSKIVETYNKLPQWLRKLFNFNKKLKRIDNLLGFAMFQRFMFQKKSLLDQVVKKDHINDYPKEFFNYNWKKGESFVDSFMRTDRSTWLVDECLMRTDKMGMAHGLEIRVPLLDKGVVEMANRIPVSNKVNVFNTKIILKEAFKRELPSFLYYQPKRGWISPGAKWLRRPKIYEMVEKILSEEYYSPTKDLFDWQAIKKILQNHKDKKEYNLIVIWNLLIFQIWVKKYRVTL
jgi:asparagine synthase (glutamine-hydrolysing)